jgi:hypothetical protein
MALLHFRLFKVSRRYKTDQRCADLEGTATLIEKYTRCRVPHSEAVKILSADFSSCTTNVVGHAAGTKYSLALRSVVRYGAGVMAELGARVDTSSIPAPLVGVVSIRMYKMFVSKNLDFNGICKMGNNSLR